MSNFLVQLNNLKLKIEKSEFLFWVLILLVASIIILVIVFNLSTAVSTQAAAGINRQITYQGKLANASGVSVTTGNYNFQFQLYDDATGGSVLWTETWTATTTAGTVGVARGVFSANLGTSTSLSTVDFNVDTLYLQVAFDSDSNGSFEEVFSPRKRITAAPYAFNADKVDGFNATSTATASQLLALDINKGLSLNSVTTTGSFYGGGYASTTLGFYTQGNLRVGGTSSFDGLLSGTGWTTSNQNFWNNTSTWAYYDTNWARQYNATTTLNGFTPANYLLAAGYYATTTWAGGNNNLTVTGFASSTAGLYTQGDLHVGGASSFDGLLSGAGWTTSNQNFWNNTSTWAYYDTNWARKYNATTTLNGFTPTSYLLTANFNSSFDAQLIATSTWSGDLVVDGNATTTGNLNVGGGGGGDSFIELAVSNVSIWSFGVDVSAGNRFVFSASGVLGTSDAFQLDTLGNATTTGRLVVGSTNPVSNYGALYVNSGVGGGAAYLVGGVTTTDSFYAGGYASSTRGLYTQGALRAGGQVSINTAANTTYALTLPNSAVTQTGYGIATGWSTYSDNRIKTEQRSLDYGLTEVLKLSPKRYIQHGSEFADGVLVLGQGNETIGLIAQEVFGVIPEVVGQPTDDSKSLWSINYSSLIPVIINAIQELSTKIDQLANKSATPVINNISQVVINNATPISVTPQVETFDYSRYTNVLTVENDLVKLDHDIVVAGNTYLNNTLSVATDSEFKGNISIGRDATFYGTITILGAAGFKYTVVFEKEVAFQDHITVDRDTAGTATIVAGATSTEVMFAKDFNIIPKVVISANSLINMNYAVTEKSIKSFRISLGHTTNQDIQFDWLALATTDNNPQNPVTPAVAGSTVVAGCRDASANNYNPSATEDDGSCTYNINSLAPEPVPESVPTPETISEPEPVVELESIPESTPEPETILEPAPTPEPVSETVN